MGSFIEEDEQVPAGAAFDANGKPLRGWQPDPTRLHEERYFSRGLPTKLFRDGHSGGHIVEGYDDVSADLVSA
jgi:hypothetical protein